MVCMKNQESKERIPCYDMVTLVSEDLSIGTEAVAHQISQLKVS